jgi:chitin disaccharide deacetylase
MARLEPVRRLVVNADDFGRSQEINAAIVTAHQSGILTTASLMVNEPGFDEAVALARQNPRLGVGLHLTLVCGRATLPPKCIPMLANANGEFSNNTVAAGCRYFASKQAREQLRTEIAAQFEKFRATGLPLDHVNGHLHLHMHPVVFDILAQHARDWGITRLRLTRDRFWLNAQIAAGRWAYRVLHSCIFRVLAARARRELDRREIRYTNTVFGLLQDSRVDEEFILKLLPRLPAGDSELYSHPSLHGFKHELDALISSRVKSRVEQLGVKLIRYQDL